MTPPKLKGADLARQTRRGRQELSVSLALATVPGPLSPALVAMATGMYKRTAARELRRLAALGQVKARVLAGRWSTSGQVDP